MASAVVPTRKMPARKGDQFLFSSSADHALIKQIESTHAPDDRDFDVKTLLQIVEDVFHRATSNVPGMVPAAEPQLEALDGKALSSGMDELLEILSRTIHKVSCELSCGCSGGGDAGSTAMAILNLLSSYKWEAKLVLSLAGFGVVYGEFWLDAQPYQTNSLATGIALLKQLPSVLEHSDALKAKLDAVTKLIQAMLDITKCIVQLNELPSQYISLDTPELVAAVACIPATVYWTIRAAVACASQIVGFIGSGHEYIGSTQESWELLSLAHNLNSVHEHLTVQLTACHKLIAERKHMEAYLMLVHLLKTPHIDNSKIISALISPNEAEMPLYDGSAKKRVGLSILRRKLVLLLISDLDVSQDEIQILENMYTESRQLMTMPESQYELVWLPIVDRTVPWSEEKEQRFKEMQSMMPWQSVYHLSIVDPAVAKYVKEDWGFSKKPILVAIDAQGKVVNKNAIHMMWIWGITAYPFTSDQEERLWNNESWRLDLLADALEPALEDWVREDKYICLYGGEDIAWIRKLTAIAREVAGKANVRLEMLYVGKSNPRERVLKNITSIQTQNLSHSLPNLTLVWFFWVRLESMWHSKTKHKKNAENDAIMQEITTMMTFDGSDQGWALICFGGTEMARAKGDMMLRCLDEYSAWSDVVGEKGFVGAINHYLKKIQTPHHCNQLILPGTEAGIPERVVCAECGRTMERFIMYRCCND